MRRTLFVLFMLCLVLFTILPTVSAQGDEVVGPDEYPDGVNPLTGLLVDDPAVLDRRPLIAKVVNAPAEARPQWGVAQADIVWEYLLAGGYTRFAAVFYSESPERVGPIRSLRLVDFELVRMYKSLLVTSGMAVGTYDVLRQDGLMLSRTISGDSPCPPLCRDEELDRKYELTLFVDTEGLRELAEEMGKDVEPESINGLAFSSAVPDGGKAIDDIQVRYAAADIVWAYDPARNVWLRSQDGEPHTDAVSGEQLEADNVIILEDEHTIQPFVSEEYWGYSNFAFSVNLIGSGRAVLLRDGQYFDGQWQRSSRDEHLRFYDNEGNLLPFKPGRSFFMLVPRWVDGYQLAFDVPEPATATVNVSSANFRWGPSQYASRSGFGYEGDAFAAIGRNNSGTWIELLIDNEPMWVLGELVTLDVPVMTLPAARSTNEY